MFLGFLFFIFIAVAAFFVLIFLGSFVPMWIAWESRDRWLNRKKKTVVVVEED